MPEITDGSADRERVEELEGELETWKEKFEELSQKVCGGGGVLKHAGVSVMWSSSVGVLLICDDPLERYSRSLLICPTKVVPNSFPTPQPSSFLYCYSFSLSSLLLLHPHRLLQLTGNC